MNRINLRRAVTGDVGLVVTMISGAVTDLKSTNEHTRQAAVEWFRSPDYRNWLELASLPVDWLPDELQNV